MKTVKAMRFSSVMLGATRVESYFYHNQISEECCRREGERAERAWKDRIIDCCCIQAISSSKLFTIFRWTGIAARMLKNLINFESEIRNFSAKNLECQRKLNSVATGAAAGRCLLKTLTLNRKVVWEYFFLFFPFFCIIP